MNSRAVESIKGSASAPLQVQIEVDEFSDRWAVELSATDESSVGASRLRTAIRRAIASDAILERFLRKGQAINLEVMKQRSDHRVLTNRDDLLRPLLMPIHIEDSLYSYQRYGVAWLLRNRRALLCDDMGLGKTAQALSAARRLVRHGKASWFLVAAPRTLIATWKYEAALWAPELEVSVVLPKAKNRNAEWRQALHESHMVVTSYEQLRNPPKALVKEPPALIIADEAHRLRKASSQISRGIRKIPAPRLWLLTGTPVERDEEDMAVLLSLLFPNRFSARDKNLGVMGLRARVRPHLLRRHKQDVLTELPEVIETVEELPLSPQQRTAYAATIEKYANRKSEQNSLALFGELRNLCDVEASSGSSSKLDRIEELLSDIAAIDEKAVVFSYTLEPLRLLQRRLSNAMPQVGHQTLIGEMELEERDAAVNEFKMNPDCKVLLASTRVASEGLTLTNARHVIFVNLWWNPSSNLQARDRVVRIGQKSTVLVRSFVCENTVESRLTQLLEEKGITFDALVTALTQDVDPSFRDALVS